MKYNIQQYKVAGFHAQKKNVSYNGKWEHNDREGNRNG